jgi:TonB family protein
MQISIILLATTLAACNVASQQCTTVQKREQDPSQKGLSLGIAVAAAPTVDQDQEKAPPDSVFVDMQPILKKKVEPVYPKPGLAAGIEGKVFVRFWIDTEGKVRDARVIKSDHDVLNQSALDAARQFEFAPATVHGKPVSMWVTVPFMFKIAEKSATAGLRELPVGLQGAAGCIMTLLSEKDVTKCKTSIAPDAYAVIGNHYVPLADAIARRGTAKGLPNEQGWEIGIVHTIMDDGAQLATMLIQTVNKKTGAFRFHTVVCVRSGEGDWKIRHWHVGQ